ncbi:MAG: hypothetical protein IM651_10070 [Phenylobacterium sp.]|nr:hypothetical protein [Phenylobacterium sp.]
MSYLAKAALKRIGELAVYVLLWKALQDQELHDCGLFRFWVRLPLRIV